MSTTAAAETSLTTKTDRTPAVITTPDEFKGALASWQASNFHVLTPFTNISGLAPSHGIIASVVQLAPEKDAGEVYDGLPFLKRDQVAPAKNGLRKVAEGLGISTKLEYISVQQIRHYWHVKAIATYRGLDGSIVTREASQEWDLRDGSDRLKGWTASQVTEGRKHGLRNCESRAINAAIRECGCGIKQVYTREELRKPFVAIRVMFVPDLGDPETRRIVTEQALRGTSALYGGAQAALPSHDAFADDDEPASTVQQVGCGATAAAAGQPAASTPAATTPATHTPNPDEPPTKFAVRIEDVKSKSGDTNGRPWTRFIIIDSNGVEHSTFDKSISDFAERAKAGRLWVEIAEESDGQYRNLVEIAPAGQQPSLPDMGNL